MKFQIYHTERNRTQGMRYGHVGFTDTRVEGPPDAFETELQALIQLRSMQDEARINGRPEYADSLHIERINDEA